MERIILPEGCDTSAQALVDEMLAKIASGAYPPRLARDVEASLRSRILLNPGHAACHYNQQAKAIYAVAESEARL